MSEFTEALKRKSGRSLYSNWHSGHHWFYWRYWYPFNNHPQRNRGAGRFDLDLNSTFTIDVSAISSAPTIGSILLANSVSYRVSSIDTSIGSYVLGLREV